MKFSDRTHFGPNALNKPLFAGDREKLAAKLADSSGLLKEYWLDFKRASMRRSKTRRQTIFLPALLSDSFVPEARRILREDYRSLPKGDCANDFQFHTWCRCGWVLRRAAFFDWLASRRAWSSDDIEEAAECFVGFAFKHPFPVLSARCRASNNQALSMALCCSVIGFLFGWKLSNHPTARFLFDYGLGRLPDMIGLFPADGYGGEGSTYTSHVNTPLFYWTHAFLLQVAGRDFLDEPFAPNGTTLRNLLAMEVKLAGPSGLLAPWDHYGWQPAINASPYAYLARATGNPAYLALIPAFDAWKDPGYLAWGQDDHLWTLLWWPEKFKDFNSKELPSELFGWFLPRTGAALDDTPRRIRLMQVWDACSGTIAGVGRAQVNPNHLILDVAGEPVFQDGVPVPDRDPWHYPASKVFSKLSETQRRRYLMYLGGYGIRGGLQNMARGIAPGLIGGANAVVVDNQPWYWPGGMRVGTPLFYARNGGLQAVSADCSSFYNPDFAVNSARRSSVWTEAGFGLVIDSLASRKHRVWTWQAYLRPDSSLKGQTAAVRLPGRKSVALAWEECRNARLRTVAGFPRTQEGRSKLLSLSQSGRTAHFSVAIAPDAKSLSVRRIGEFLFEIRIDGARHLIVADNFRRRRISMGRSCSTTAVFAWMRPDGSLSELLTGIAKPPRPDKHEIDDIAADRDLQYPQFRRLTRWSAVRRFPSHGALAPIDDCLAEMSAVRPDIAKLSFAISGSHWPSAVAAAEVAGRRRISELAPVLRKRLVQEHSRPSAELYPPLECPPRGRSVEEAANRWRLKAALITALGRLQDRESVPILGRILRDGKDFYTVYSAAAQALGRIGGPDALRALKPALLESEHNTHVRAHFAAAAIRGRKAT